MNRAPAAASIDAAEYRALLDGALQTLDRDEHSGTVLRASGMRVRFDFTDLELRLDVAASEEGKRHYLRWTFSRKPSWEPKLRLAMDSRTANAYLQGKESLAIAIARGRVRCKGDSRTALLYVPLMRLFVDPYRASVQEGYPQLAI